MILINDINNFNNDELNNLIIINNLKYLSN